ncbi:hypothetical protein, partial [Kocuria himachalensis]
MAPSTSPFLWAFLQLLSQRGPLSAQDIAAHHFPASTPELRADLASDIAEQLWEAFALGLVAVYQAERGAPDCFVLTKAGVEALHAVHTPAEEQGEDFTTDAGSGEDIVEGAVARHPGQGDDL